MVRSRASRADRTRTVAFTGWPRQLLQSSGRVRRVVGSPERTAGWHDECTDPNEDAFAAKLRPECVSSWDRIAREATMTHLTWNQSARTHLTWNQSARAGALLLWLVGVPVPLVLVVYLLFH